ncbi:transglutaminase family protein [Pedobacter sp. SYSU D00535]|uniref:transglutaminase family protein n=1 Tax=Pedobacter sp. SYSU D00535 TaxID=2810308 RepID=UPI001A96A596|nr:transglutaminase family protein [Pedobacter sp. SYSU D00535]
MPEFTIKHITSYLYRGEVYDSANQIILYPISDEYQEVQSQELLITGNPQIAHHTDYYGNKIGTFTVREPHTYLEILSRLKVVTRARPIPEDTIFAGEQWTELEKLQKRMPYVDFLNIEHFSFSDEIAAIIKTERVQTPFKTALHFCRYVYENFEYIPGITNVETQPDEIWKLKAGVCQDFAHMLLVMLRHIRIPSRYVSGYICPNKNGMRGEGATHAWVESFIPGYGWMGLDPTNNCIVNDTHVRLAVGRNFTDCSPVKGVYRGNPEHQLKVNVTVSYQGDEPEANEYFVVLKPEPVNLIVKNSFALHQELMEQQQQQQQQQ